MPFSDLGLSPILNSVVKKQFSSPTQIQTLTIPAVLDNRDVLAIAQTGSGKTLAYGLPLVEQIQSSQKKIQALILVPTRELAAQVHQALARIANDVDLAIIELCGGRDKEPQKEQLALSPNILVATPGRLLDLIKEGALDTQSISKLVLDEVDRLVDMGFWPDIQTILASLPNTRQTLLFSATLPQELETTIRTLVKDPVLVRSNTTNSVVETITEQMYLVNKGSKANVLIHLIKQYQWEQVLVFIGARDNADAMCKKLRKAGISTHALHGQKEQVERETALEQFKDKSVQVLISTDLLARGIHIDQLPVVINAELPANPATYVHRVGRTARAGQNGLAISLVSHSESEYLQAIRKLTNCELPLGQLEEFPVTDKPSTGASKRAPRDKQANRRTNKKTSARQFQKKVSR